MHTHTFDLRSAVRGGAQFVTHQVTQHNTLMATLNTARSCFLEQGVRNKILEVESGMSDDSTSNSISNNNIILTMIAKSPIAMFM